MNASSEARKCLIARAKAWQNEDPDGETVAELGVLIDQAADTGDADASAQAFNELHSRFDRCLTFGTAGLRGPIAAGPNRMNRVVVAQTSAGLAAYLLQQTRSGDTPSVIIGYDGRKNSRVFANDAAEIMAGAGVCATLLPRMLPTPVLAFAVRYFGASAGVMVTASHNPAGDNGYKVYVGGDDHGSQIIPPIDAEIADRIRAVAENGSVRALPRAFDYGTADNTVVDAYVAATAAVATGSHIDVSVVYTPLHGVGWETARAVFRAVGCDNLTIVEAQREPDPNFPTVSFPNPEEDGALDLAFVTAREQGAELVIANDPDADRLAVAIPDTRSAEGYRRLTGNEIGALLGWRAAERAGTRGTLACSVVSSSALRAIAHAYDLEFVDTLTGFKWISRIPGLIFGYEEALGYLVNPETVGDKDGISAAVAVMSLAAELKTQGLTIADQLDRFSDRFGLFASSQISIRTDDVTQIATIMALLREQLPSHVGDTRVTDMDDFSGGFGAFPPSDILRLVLEDGSRIMVRPSGTEPKLKIYIDVQSRDGSREERQRHAEMRLCALDRSIRELVGV